MRQQLRWWQNSDISFGGDGSGMANIGCMPIFALLGDLSLALYRLFQAPAHSEIALVTRSSLTSCCLQLLVVRSAEQLVFRQY